MNADNDDGKKESYFNLLNAQTNAQTLNNQNNEI